MRKDSKLMIRAVAILLILVLFTGSIVSTTLARYTIKKTIQSNLYFQKFGVKVGMTVNEDILTAYGSDYVAATDSNSISLELTGGSLKLHPGTSFPDAVKFSISGRPNVDVKVKVIFSLAYSYGNYKIEEDIGSVSGDQNYYYMPIGFTFGTAQNTMDYTAKPWRVYQGESPENSDSSAIEINHTEYVIAQAIEKRIDATAVENTGSGKDSYVEKSFYLSDMEENETVAFYSIEEGTNTTTPINEISLGFEWPFEWPSDDFEGTDEEKAALIQKHDLLGTYIARKATNSFTVKYTIVLEQIG